MPTIAAIHIQKIAPGPPIVMAYATPAMLPVPIVADRAVQSAWNCDMECLSSLLRMFLLRVRPPMVSFHM